MKSILSFGSLLLLVITPLLPVHASIGPVSPSSSFPFGSQRSISSKPPRTIPPAIALSPKQQKPFGTTITSVPRGGQTSDAFVRLIGTCTQIVISLGRAVLPPMVALTKGIVGFYRALPVDAVVAQIGLVYCFLGGYYPTLFSALEAAQQCGWNVMVQSITELTEEAIKVIDATSEISPDSFSRKELFLRQTNIVLKTVDPMKINQAAGALYTTWLGVSSVLQREYARVISLSLTLAGYLERIAHFVLEPPVKMCISRDYHQWVPVVIGWGCKAAAMNVAWRIQRVLTASTSAMAGGIMFSRAILRMASKRGIRFFGLIRQVESDIESPLEDVIGFLVAGLGFYTQIETQFKNGFTFEVPFPLSLITWPFDLAERWIQWEITQ
eukprot:scaffold15718_cov126-Cylindrotheca_fusiformis.AAC.2